MQAPIGIDEAQYKRQAKELLRSARLEDEAALTRIRAHRPQFSTSMKSGEPASLKLAGALLVIARENGFASWPRFVDYLRFRNALAALDAGDVARLEALLDAHPSLCGYECRVGEWYEEGYFAGAKLLWHIAGNPNRGPLPKTIVEVAHLLARRGCTHKDAQTTIGLLLSSKQASELGVALPLIDVLTSAGAHFDVRAPDILAAPLLNHAPETAEALVRRGASMKLRDASALGELSVMSRILDEPVAQETLNEALVFASVRGQGAATALLLEHGARGDVLLSPGGQTARTALHEAANRGHGEVVELLLASGASALVLDARWMGTASGWAEAGGHAELAARLRECEGELRARE